MMVSILCVLLCSCTSTHSQNENNTTNSDSLMQESSTQSLEESEQVNISIPSEVEEYINHTFDEIPEDLDVRSCVERNLNDLQIANELVAYANDYLETNPDIAYQLWHNAMDYYADFANVIKNFPHYYGENIVKEVDPFYRAIQESDSIYSMHTNNLSNGIAYTEEDAQIFIENFDATTNTISEFIQLYAKQFSYSDIEEKPAPINPAIGMTREEVENSTWGKPKKINKTTYSWGTTEQWCYPNYKYIYFENGVVTAIQE